MRLNLRFRSDSLIADRPAVSYDRPFEVLEIGLVFPY